MDDKLPLVSVVVPVYNVERYVRQCAESLVAQTYPRLEIILVDDGATDSSGEICDEIASAHDNVTCFHKENGGLSDARNYGLLHSHGEWISFVDSDDYVSPIWIEALYCAAFAAACPISAVVDGTRFIDGTNVSLCTDAAEVPLPRVMDDCDVLRGMLYQQITTGAQWRLYRRDVLGENPFPKGLYYEDLASTYKFVHRARKVALLDFRGLYAYRLRSGSIIRQSYRHVKGYSAVTVANQLYRDISEWYPDLQKAASSRCFAVCRMVFGQVPAGRDATDEEFVDRQALWEVLKRHRSVVVGDSEARPRERLAACIACMGEEPFTALCGLARRMGKMQ
jgi:glycosyltransferase involved in cell wall biosynthesis